MKENSFIHRIDKEIVNAMPVVAFDGETFVINRLDQIEGAMQYLNGQKIVGVDTETRPSFTRGQHFPVALAQIATEERCYLFQLTHIGLPEQLASFFANEKIRKVGLAFKDDLNALRRRREFMPQNCVDIQQIGPTYGILDLGLQRMFAICFGKKISKAQQLTNWENVELTPEQARYASTDAWATLLIYNELMRTKQLPKKQLERLKAEDRKKQMEHQLAVIAAREAEAAHHSSSNEEPHHDNDNPA